MSENLVKPDLADEAKVSAKKATEPSVGENVESIESTKTYEKKTIELAKPSVIEKVENSKSTKFSDGISEEHIATVMSEANKILNTESHSTVVSDINENIDKNNSTERKDKDMQNNLAERSNKRLASSVELAKDIITKDYLCNLEKYEIEPIHPELQKLNISNVTRLYRFKKLVLDKKESTIEKLVTVLNAAYVSNSTVITIIKSNSDYIEYYMGIVNKSGSKNDIATQSATFERILRGNFPGLEIEPMMNDEFENIHRSVFSGYNNNITSISGIASLRNEKEYNMEKYVQGIEHIVDSMHGQNYSIVVVADPIQSEEIALAKLGYENLYTQLSPFQKTSFSLNESENTSTSISYTNGIAKSISESTSLTQNYTESNGWSESTNKSTGKSKTTASTLLAIAGGAVGALFGPGGVALGASVGSSVGGFWGSTSEGESTSRSTNKNTSESNGSSSTNGYSNTEQRSKTDSTSTGSTHGQTFQISNENRSVKSLLSKIDRQIERLDKCEAFGAFNCATYVISSNPQTNSIVSGGYNALMRGDNSALQASFINNWDSSNWDTFSTLREYLKKFTHPQFYNENSPDVVVNPASIVNSYEMAVNLGWPKKSINGMPVSESIAFGRNVFDTNGSVHSRKSVYLGDIYHMGITENTPVNLDLQSLAMHTFITGSTGSGKSNTVYQMIRELRKNHVGFLVIEPAKGEYKHIFGNEDVSVYGTNPYCSPLLKINPFAFPKGIHVLEHIDRLIEIFNVCWPMYAAMPAVLKDSVEKAYLSAGWDLSTSANKYSELLFPTFADVLTQLENVVKESKFSQEVKDNYVGSLATRIRSLTNGIYGKIFSNEELGDYKLFDENVIVDLSRVGSVETKSMLMGILVMRLQEYRMTSGVFNANLHHVTVLEEAHNLLKRTSVEQSSESANLLGKSVEMLANAIAEVRTYGEGFIIADQAPGLLDMSVIRNTNTKIIMRLPDEEDRKLVGKSANLTDDQIKELAKLPTGIAAIYQNNWLEPVLSKIQYENTQSAYRFAGCNPDESDNRIKEIIIRSLLDKVEGEHLCYNLKEITSFIVASSLTAPAKTKIIRLFDRAGKIRLEEISDIVYDMACDSETKTSSLLADSIYEWRDILLYDEDSVLYNFDESRQNKILECILRVQISKFNKPQEYLDEWYRFLEEEMM